ncbi:thiol reductant ABC exporter subunit CydC [Rhizobium rhizosphaerae]|uniref:Thiol reductant ABC exporter subunit CydC n=1 Tax=Xaviernesmea rhizosphaerae TaxID=1672749 RepID=A0A1Q9ALG6_9HYPH|nr:thiol reductant ABC exporter subunit CydC [Xaviernesmea rhizosphaerae]OLP56133.1 thiol reductant ABC exporter subunit CydC [Xaviernesmea rhizosphaerae]
MSLLDLLWPLYRREAPRLLAALGLGLVTLFAGIALLGISGWFLTAAALSTAGMAFNLFGPSSLIRGLSLLRILARYGERIAGHDATLALLAALRGDVFARLLARIPLGRLPDETGAAMAHGDLVSRLTADIDQLESLFVVGVGPLVNGLLAALALGVALALLLPSALLPVLFALALAIIGVPLLLLLLARRPARAVARLGALLRGAVIEAIESRDDLRAFGRTALAQTRFEQAAAELGRARRRLALSGALAGAAMQALTACALLAVLLLGTRALSSGAITGPLLVGLLLGTLASFEAVAAILRGVARFGPAAAAAERLAGLLDAPAAIVAEPHTLSLPNSLDIAFEAVHFAYEPGRPALSGLTLKIGCGERVALTGPSGSGKSTLFALILRLHDPDAGRVLLGGIDLKCADPDEIHAAVAVLEQDAPLFMGSVRDNLLIGNPRCGDAALWAMLEAVQMADLVAALPGGLDAFVGETGHTLSAGQARRLCLARTLLSPAPILLLDEPTASLDPTLEQAIFEALPRLTAGRTLVVATHAPPAMLKDFNRKLHLCAQGALEIA